MTTPTPDTRTFPWRVEQGERERLVIPIVDGAFPVDVTGWTVDAKVKTSHELGAPTLYTWPAEHVKAIGTSVELLIPADVSLAWHWQLGWYRVKVTDPASIAGGDPDPQRVLQGPFIVDPD